MSFFIFFVVNDARMQLREEADVRLSQQHVAQLETEIIISKRHVKKLVNRLRELGRKKLLYELLSDQPSGTNLSADQLYSLGMVDANEERKHLLSLRTKLDKITLEELEEFALAWHDSGLRKALKRLNETKGEIKALKDSGLPDDHPNVVRMLATINGLQEVITKYTKSIQASVTAKIERHDERVHQSQEQWKQMGNPKNLAETLSSMSEVRQELEQARRRVDHYEGELENARRHLGNSQ
ncbi:hypothetical protein JIN77_00220 [Verrucomicrobiaceae bacterium R5-34]|nr:hypothetical protein [Verrucomicrobiaceae bacterium R5-34]